MEHIPDCRDIQLPISLSMENATRTESNFIHGTELNLIRPQISSTSEKIMGWLGYDDGFTIFLWKPESEILQIPLKGSNIEIDYEEHLVIVTTDFSDMFAFEEQDSTLLQELYEVISGAAKKSKTVPDSLHFIDMNDEDKLKLEKKKALGQSSLKRFSVSPVNKRHGSISPPPPTLPSFSKTNSVSQKLFGNVSDSFH
jgi:hypothetical protein